MTNLPKLNAGDVYYGELTLTNYGLVRAENLAPQLPQSDAFLRYEFLGTIPASLEAKQRLTIPYRIVALKSLEPDGAATGGGCFDYLARLFVPYDFECANGYSQRRWHGERAGPTPRGRVARCRSLGGFNAGGGSTGGGGGAGSAWAAAPRSAAPAAAPAAPAPWAVASSTTCPPTTRFPARGASQAATASAAAPAAVRVEMAASPQVVAAAAATTAWCRGS